MRHRSHHRRGSLASVNCNFPLHRSHLANFAPTMPNHANLPFARMSYKVVSVSLNLNVPSLLSPIPNMWLSWSTFALLCFSKDVVAGYTRNTIATKGGLPPSLQPFVDGLSYFLDRSSYHSAVDLKPLNIHHRLSNYFFEHGHEYNPIILWLGRDREDAFQHLAVAHFKPDEELLHRMLPAGWTKKEYGKRQGLLAMALASHDEPDFIGVLWHSDTRNAQKIQDVMKMHRLMDLEGYKRTDDPLPPLEDVLRVTYHRPI